MLLFSREEHWVQGFRDLVKVLGTSGWSKRSRCQVRRSRSDHSMFQNQGELMDLGISWVDHYSVGVFSLSCLPQEPCCFAYSAPVPRIDAKIQCSNVVSGPWRATCACWLTRHCRGLVIDVKPVKIHHGILGRPRAADWALISYDAMIEQHGLKRYQL